MLKQTKDGTWKIENAKDLEAAVEAIEEREQAVEDLEAQMEEEYDYLTMKQEVVSLNDAVRAFMAEAKMAHVFRDDYKITLIRRTTSTWNADKLKSLVPKPLWLKITTPVIDPDKIHALVQEGKLDDKLIAPALVSTPQKPFIQRFAFKKGQTKEDAQAEEMALRAAMSGEAAPVKRGGKRK